MTLIFFIYFLIAFILAPFSVSSLDTFYYWDWSRHLALSYFDGPPLIAYLIRASTALLGDTLFALNGLGILLTALTAFILYLTAALFLSKKASLISVSLWLFSPLTTLDLLHQTTYDNPQALFWTLTLFFVVKYLKTQQVITLYGVGVSVGFLLLSKYTGIVLVLALLLFLVTTQYRRLFLSVHFYLALLIAALIFSPVLIWNYQRDWLSFRFQLGVHTLRENTNPLISMLKAFLEQFFPMLNVFLFTPLVCWIKRLDMRSPILYLCVIVSTVFLTFYLLLSMHVTLRPLWLLPYLNTTVLLAGFLYEKGLFKRFTHFLIALFFVFSIFMLINNVWIHLGQKSKTASYYLIKQFNADFHHDNRILLTANWLEARPFFFLNPHVEIYTIKGEGRENQYGLWSQSIDKKLRSKSIKDAFYVDFTHRMQCYTHTFKTCPKGKGSPGLKYLRQAFEDCRPLKTRPYYDGEKMHYLYAYHCENP